MGMINRRTDPDPIDSRVLRRIARMSEDLEEYKRRAGLSRDMQQVSASLDALESLSYLSKDIHKLQAAFRDVQLAGGRDLTDAIKNDRQL